ncbi:hypothetical protein D3C84_905330 [compost metagenome]
MLSLVCRPRISSISAMTGTGLKKCMPMKRSGRPVAAASLVIDIDEVLLAIRVCGPTMASMSLRICSFSASASVAASITRSVSTRACLSVLLRRRPRMSRWPASSMLPLRSSLSRLPSMLCRPRSSAASEMSTMITSRPAMAQTWAMPLPIVPAPITPTVCICISLLPVFC